MTTSSNHSDAEDTSWRALFLSGGIAVAIFIGGTITDSGEYKATYTPPANSLVQTP